MEREKFLKKQIEEIDLDPSIVSSDKDIYNATQFFTPLKIIKEMVIRNKDVVTDFDKTFLDNSSGDGAIILYILNKRLLYLKKENKISLVNILNALKTLFGIEYEYETVWKQRIIIYNTIKEFIDSNKLEFNEIFKESVKNILVSNFKFGAWPIKEKEKAIEFTDYDRSSSIEINGFPEWHIFPNCNVRKKEY